MRLFNKFRCYLTTLMLLIGGCAAWGQDPVFSQFYATPLHTNPAFAGITYAPRITLNYRNQWPAFNNAYVTYAVSYEQSLVELNSGIGLIVMTDNAGDGIYKINRFRAVYGYQVQVNDDFFVKFGVEGGIIQNTVDWNKLIFGDQIELPNGFSDPFGNPIPSQEAPPESLNKSSLDIGAGLLLYGKNFYGGVAAKHLNSPDESLLEINENLNVGLPLRLTIHGGAEFALERGNNHRNPSFISPNIMFNSQGAFWQVNAGAYAGLSSVFGGLWFRHSNSTSDSVIGLLGYRYGILRIGYSYDYTISQLADSGTGGTHEVSLIINLDESREVKRSRRAARYNDCFKMFN